MMNGKPNANVSLIQRKIDTCYPEYAVVRNLDPNKPMESNEQWDCTIGYFSYTSEGLSKAVDLFRYKTEENYISRMRLEELATNFKDYIFDLEEDKNVNEVINELVDCYDISENEIEFFGLQKDDETE